MNNILIVGASRGIGLGLASVYLEKGHRVYALARQPVQSKGLAELRTAYPEQLHTLEGDLLDTTACAHHIAHALNDALIDRLILNAGISGPTPQDVTLCSDDQIQALFLINAIAPVRLAKVLMNKIAPGGIIGFMSSIMASQELNLSADKPLYGASKSTLNSLIRSWQAELGDLPFSLLALHPGWVKTDMGGDAAPVSIEESTQGLYSVIESSAQQNLCRFVDYQGHTIPW